MQKDTIKRFLGIPEHNVENIHFLNEEGNAVEKDEEVHTVVVELQREGRTYRCKCGRIYNTYYDYREKFIRDLPWGPWRRVELLAPRFRVKCVKCGVRTEPLEWIVPHCTYTKRLADAVALACREIRCITDIAEAFDLGWDTVKKIDKKRLEEDLNPPDLSGLRYLSLDEFSLKRRHHYATMFLDVERNRVLWICKTRTQEEVTKVFREVFKEDICDKIEAVAMDMWDPYEAAVRECLPNAKIVWDLFHVVKMYNKEVVDRVRIDECHRCGKDHKEIKGSKYILLKNRDNMEREEIARLQDLLRINKRLFTVHVLREGLKKLWEYTYPKRAEEWFESWYNRAIRSKIAPLKKFALTLKKRLYGILPHCRYRIHSGIIEGAINKVKVIKRVAYGFRDFDYFFLKIRGHFQGVDPP